MRSRQRGSSSPLSRNRAPGVAQRVVRRAGSGCWSIALAAGKVVASEVEHVGRLLDEGSRDKVVEDSLNLRVLLQVLGVLEGDRLLQAGLGPYLREGGKARLRGQGLWRWTRPTAVAREAERGRRGRAASGLASGQGRDAPAPRASHSGRREGAAYVAPWVSGLLERKPRHSEPALDVCSTYLPTPAH